MKKSVKTLEIPFLLAAQPDWTKAHCLSDFRDPWRSIDDSSIVLRLIHTLKHVHFQFEVREPSPIVSGHDSDKMGVTLSDRVELFFSKDESLAKYYCLEIDSTGRLLDYMAKYHRIFNFEWNWPSEEIAITRNSLNGSYTIQISLTKSYLKKIGVLKDNTLRSGVFRGKPLLQTTGSNEDFEWYSWIDPKTESPEFHTPSAFGKFILKR